MFTPRTGYLSQVLIVVDPSRLILVRQQTLGTAAAARGCPDLRAVKKAARVKGRFARAMGAPSDAAAGRKVKDR
jgi:hypothetical protein